MWFTALVIVVIQSSCCSDCGDDWGEFFIEPCDTTAEFMPLEEQTLAMYHTPDTMVFRYKREGEFMYILESLVVDTTTYSRCDTMYSFLTYKAVYSTTTTYPAQRKFTLTLYKSAPYPDVIDMFSISTTGFLTEVPVESLTPDSKHDLVSYRDTLDTWYLTNLGDIYILEAKERASDGVHIVFYSKTQGLMAIHGGQDYYDGFSRVR